MRRHLRNDHAFGRPEPGQCPPPPIRTARQKLGRMCPCIRYLDMEVPGGCRLDMVQRRYPPAWVTTRGRRPRWCLPNRLTSVLRTPAVAAPSLLLRRYSCVSCISRVGSDCLHHGSSFLSSGPRPSLHIVSLGVAICIQIARWSPLPSTSFVIIDHQHTHTRVRAFGPDVPGLPLFGNLFKLDAFPAVQVKAFRILTKQYSFSALILQGTPDSPSYLPHGVGMTNAPPTLCPSNISPRPPAPPLAHPTNTKRLFADAESGFDKSSAPEDQRNIWHTNARYVHLPRHRKWVSRRRLQPMAAAPSPRRARRSSSSTPAG